MPKKSVDIESLSINEALSEVDEIIDILEERDTALEDAYKAYERGIKLLNTCNQKIDKVEKQIKILEEEKDNEA